MCNRRLPGSCSSCYPHSRQYLSSTTYVSASGTHIPIRRTSPLTIPVPQSLPKAKSKTPATTTKSAGDIDFVDPDSEIAKTLQPLLEQEALLESFVEEATASRKFEDAKTLRVNLKEIRDEIERIVGEAEAGGKGLQKK